MKILKKTLAVLLTAVLVLTAFAGCAKDAESEVGFGISSEADSGASGGVGFGLSSGADTAVSTAESTVSRDLKFGAATVALSQEEFESNGFVLGDSCDVTFENGYTLKNVPYYNGYYVKNGAAVIVAYPGMANIAITYNNVGIWNYAELEDGYKVTVTLREPGAYSDIQESLGQQYSFDRSTYDSDEMFCNFRELSGGELKAGRLFRGASPVDNSRGRAPYTDALLENAGIKCLIDLADSEADIAGYMAASDFASDYAAELIGNGQAALLDMGSAYQSELYQKSVAEGMRKLLSSKLPAYIHCMEGKDRTGFVCMLVEALCGASYDEMLADYMQTYANYYRVTKDGAPGKYQAIAELYFDAFVSYLHGTEDVDELRSADYSADATAYLMEGGMTEAEINDLVMLLTE